MKQFFIALLFSAQALMAFSQQPDLRRKIDVTGSAEMEITPDILYIGIALKEYYNGNKRTASIEELEQQLQKAVAKAGIPRENLAVNNISSYNYDWERKKNPNFAARKQYRLKLSEPSLFTKVLAGIDPRNIEYTNIESVEHSRMPEFRRQLKIQALRAAREKAGYLAEAVGDQVGDALDIQELNNDEGPTPMYANSVYRFKTEDAASDASAPIDFKKIKLNYQVKAIFELKK